MTTSYDYYVTKYLGNAIQDEAEFMRLARMAELQIRHITAGKSLEKAEKLQEAVCAVCELLQQDMGDVCAESVDGYSVTYQSTTITKRIEELLRLYLPIELLYKGV